MNPELKTALKFSFLKPGDASSVIPFLSNSHVLFGSTAHIKHAMRAAKNDTGALVTTKIGSGTVALVALTYSSSQVGLDGFDRQIRKVKVSALCVPGVNTQDFAVGLTSFLTGAMRYQFRSLWLVTDVPLANDGSGLVKSNWFVTQTVTGGMVRCILPVAENNGGSEQECEEEIN